MTTLIPPLAFWAEDQADAERQALEWARKEPRIVSASIVNAYPNGHHADRWYVEIEATFATEPEQAGLGL